MTLKYLIAGATGGLGKQVLNYFAANVPLSKFAAASSNTFNESIFADRGIAFRHVNYDDPQSLETGLRDVENLLFLSTSDGHRREQHARLIEAAKKAGVKHVCLTLAMQRSWILSLTESTHCVSRSGIWYTSLAFGGLQNNSKAPVMQDHLFTENYSKSMLCIPYLY
jgi:hypothetical protein